MDFDSVIGCICWCIWTVPVTQIGIRGMRAGPLVLTATVCHLKISIVCAQSRDRIWVIFFGARPIYNASICIRIRWEKKCRRTSAGPCTFSLFQPSGQHLHNVFIAQWQTENIQICMFYSCSSNIQLQSGRCPFWHFARK